MIEVTISPFEVMCEAPPQVGLEQYTRFLVLGLLRKAGAPVTGTLLPELKAGVLTRYENLHNDTVTFRWQES